MSEPQHSLEVERKYDAEAETPLPDFSALPGVVSVGQPEPRELDAVYLDTADNALALARTALRRRTGGPDEGWHIKRATSAGKHESRWPLGDVTDEVLVPDELAAVLADVSGGPFAPIARIRNARIAYALTDAGGALVAEFVDDRVIATDVRRGIETRWREWEMELGEAAPPDPAWRAAFFTAVDAAVQAAGGRVATSDSKLGRALGAV